MLSESHVSGGVFNNVLGDYNVYHSQEGLSREGDPERDYPGKGLEILHQMALTNASYDAEQRFPPPRCHPNTRIQILDILRTWAKDSSKRVSIYWLYGAAGVGKSAVAQTIAEELSPSHLVASFFFSRSVPARNNLSSFFITICQQLVVSPTLGPLLRNSIGTIIRRMRNIVHSTLEQQFQKLIVEPCRQLSADQWKSLPRLIIIDGLDECVDIPSQERLLSIIRQAKMAEPPLPFEFLICSRPEPRIRSAFNHDGFKSSLDRVDLGDGFEAGKDIARFLRHEFHKIHREHGAIGHVAPDWPGEGIIQQLVQRASGQFIYATTVVKYIGGYDGLPTERLDIILNIIVPEDFDSPYPDLDLLYLQILSPCRERKLLLEVLSYLLHPKMVFDYMFHKPSAYKIEGLFFLPKGKILSLFFGLHSVLHIPDDPLNGTITVRHASFVDFLTDRKRSGTFFVSKSHQLLAVSLLKRASLYVENKGGPNHYYTAFEMYALIHWGFHCSKVTETPTGNFLSLLEELDLCKLVNIVQRDAATCAIFFGSARAALKKCLIGLDKVSKWAKNWNPALANRYGLFQEGFQVQVPSTLNPADRHHLKRHVTILAYFIIEKTESTSPLGRQWQIVVPRPPMLDHNLSKKEIEADFHSIPPILALQKTPTGWNGAGITSRADSISVVFSDYHKEVGLKYLQIMQVPTNKEDSWDSRGNLQYARHSWLYHLLEADPAKNFQLLRSSLSSLKHRGDAKEALNWLKESSLPNVIKEQAAQIIDEHIQRLMRRKPGQGPMRRKPEQGPMHRKPEQGLMNRKPEQGPMRRKPERGPMHRKPEQGLMNRKPEQRLMHTKPESFLQKGKQWFFKIGRFRT